MSDNRKILVKLFANLRDYGDREQEIYFKEGMTPKEVVEKFKIPMDDVAILMINGRRVKLDRELVEDDVLAIFPPVGGG